MRKTGGPPALPLQDTLFNRLLGPEKQTPQSTVNLLTSTVKMGDEDNQEMRFCFRIVSPQVGAWGDWGGTTRSPQVGAGGTGGVPHTVLSLLAEGAS